MEPNNPGDPTFPSQPQQPQYPPQPPQYPPQPGYPQPPYSPVQGYGQPQYPPQPVHPMYAQPPQPPKNSAKPWIIGCSIAAGVVIVICAALAIVLYIGAQRAGSALQSVGTSAEATTAAQDFCTEMQQQDYAAAYQLLSTAEQGRVGSESQFESHETALDTSSGSVDTCSPDSSSGQVFATVSSDGKSATAAVRVARSNSTNSASGNIDLVLEDGQWKVDGADSSLQLFS